MKGPAVSWVGNGPSLTLQAMWPERQTEHLRLPAGCPPGFWAPGVSSLHCPFLHFPPSLFHMPVLWHLLSPAAFNTSFLACPTASASSDLLPAAHCIQPVLPQPRQRGPATLHSPPKAPSPSSMPRDPSGQHLNGQHLSGTSQGSYHLLPLSFLPHPHHQLPGSL